MPQFSRGFQFLATEVRGLQAAVYVLALSAVLSSLLALVRDRLLAHAFGASTSLDLYYAAFRIPDLLFVATGALVSVYILIPELAKRSEAAQKDYIDTILVGFSLLAVGTSVLAAFFAPFLISHLFPQFTASGFAPTLVLLTRIMLLQPILLGLSNIFAAITQSKHRYALYSLSPLLYNLGIIVGILVLYPLWGLPGLAWGVVLGAALHVGIQVPSMFADGFLHRMPRIFERGAITQTFAISVPRALALSMSQLTFLGLTVLAGGLSAGSIAIFMFAYNLESVPLAIIGASYSVAAFPTLAQALSRGEREAFIEHISNAARYVVFWSLPALSLLIVLRAHVVRVVLGSGAFDWTDTRLTAATLAVLSLALAAQGLMLLLVRGYYAAGRTFMPFAVNLGTTVGTLGLGVLLVHALDDRVLLSFMQQLLRIQDIPGGNVLALAFAYASVTIVGAIVLTLHFNYRFPGFLTRVARGWGESVLAALAGGFGAYAMLSLLGPLTLASTTASVFTKGFAAGVVGIIVSALVYKIMRNREYQETVLAIRARVLRRPDSGLPRITVAAPAEETGPAGLQ